MDCDRAVPLQILIKFFFGFIAYANINMRLLIFEQTARVSLICIPLEYYPAAWIYLSHKFVICWFFAEFGTVATLQRH